jgi:hypothetical protein
MCRAQQCAGWRRRPSSHSHGVNPPLTPAASHIWREPPRRGLRGVSLPGQQLFVCSLLNKYPRLEHVGHAGPPDRSQSPASSEGGGPGGEDRGVSENRPEQSRSATVAQGCALDDRRVITVVQAVGELSAVGGVRGDDGLLRGRPQAAAPAGWRRSPAESTAGSDTGRDLVEPQEQLHERRLPAYSWPILCSFSLNTSPDCLQCRSFSLSTSARSSVFRRKLFTDAFCNLFG